MKLVVHVATMIARVLILVGGRIEIQGRRLRAFALRREIKLVEEGRPPRSAA